MKESIFFTKKSLLGFSVILLLVFLYFPMQAVVPEATNLSVLLFLGAALFWAFEIIPPFATSISLVVLLTLFLTKPGGVLNLDEKGFKLFFSQLANPIILLFLGGFVLAKALSKYHIDQNLAKAFLSRIGKSSFSILSGHLFLTAFLSMWISNTAAAVIVLSLIRPLLMQIPKGDPLQKGLPLAVAFGASIGGIATPIGTPPNALAIGILAEHGISISFFNWVAMALPLAILILGIASLILWFFFSSKTVIVEHSYELKPLTKKSVAVILGAVFMILLWLTSSFHKIPESLVALMGVSYFVAFRLIDAEDFKQISWDTLFLMWGGLALGEAMIVSDVIPSLFGTKIGIESGIWVFSGFCFFALVLSSFMSNTAAANLLLPVIISFSPENKILLSITIALSCSLSLTFPIATPPNALAYSFRTFSTKDMFKSGFIISVLAIIIILIGFDRVIPLFISG